MVMARCRGARRFKRKEEKARRESLLGHHKYRSQIDPSGYTTLDELRATSAHGHIDLASLSFDGGRASGAAAQKARARNHNVEAGDGGELAAFDVDVDVDAEDRLLFANAPVLKLAEQVTRTTTSTLTSSLSSASATHTHTHTHPSDSSPQQNGFRCACLFVIRSQNFNYESSESRNYS